MDHLIHPLLQKLLRRIGVRLHLLKHVHIRIAGECCRYVLGRGVHLRSQDLRAIGDTIRLFLAYPLPPGIEVPAVGDRQNLGD